MRDLLMAYLGLKDVVRQGWVNAGVQSLSQLLLTRGAWPSLL